MEPKDWYWFEFALFVHVVYANTIFPRNFLCYFSENFKWFFVWWSALNGLTIFYFHYFICGKMTMRKKNCEHQEGYFNIIYLFLLFFLSLCFPEPFLKYFLGLLVWCRGILTFRSIWGLLQAKIIDLSLFVFHYSLRIENFAQNLL